MARSFGLATFTVAALTLTLATGALAQGPGQGPVASACAGEIVKYCAGKEHGQGKIRACLEANKDKVSAACKTALDNTGPGRRKP